VRLIPVAALSFLRFPISCSITPERLRDPVQCVIRDTGSPRRKTTTWSKVLVPGRLAISF